MTVFRGEIAMPYGIDWTNPATDTLLTLQIDDGVTVTNLLTGATGETFDVANIVGVADGSFRVSATWTVKPAAIDSDPFSLLQTVRDKTREYYLKNPLITNTEQITFDEIKAEAGEDFRLEIVYKREKAGYSHIIAGSTSSNYLFYQSGIRIKLGGSDANTGGLGADLGVWYSLVMVRTGANLVGYLDGVEVYNETDSTGAVTLFRALYASQYSSSSSVSMIRFTVPNNAAMNRYWTFDKSRGDSVIDHINGAVATLVDFPVDSGYVRGDDGNVAGYVMGMSTALLSLVGAYSGLISYSDGSELAISGNGDYTIASGHSLPIKAIVVTDTVNTYNYDGTTGEVDKLIETVIGNHAIISNSLAGKWQLVLHKNVYQLKSDGSLDFSTVNAAVAATKGGSAGLNEFVFHDKLTETENTYISASAVKNWSFVAAKGKNNTAKESLAGFFGKYLYCYDNNIFIKGVGLDRIFIGRAIDADHARIETLTYQNLNSPQRWSVNNSYLGTVSCVVSGTDVFINNTIVYKRMVIGNSSAAVKAYIDSCISLSSVFALSEDVASYAAVGVEIHISNSYLADADYLSKVPPERNLGGNTESVDFAGWFEDEPNKNIAITRVGQDFLADNICSWAYLELDQALSVYADLDIQFSTLGSVFSDVEIQGQILSALTSVVADLDTRLQIYQAVLANVELQQAIYGIAIAGMDFRYGIHGSVTADVEFSYGIFASAYADIALQFAMAGSVTADLYAQFQLLGAVVSDVDVQAQILTAIEKDIEIQQLILTSVSADVELQYFVYGAAIADLSIEYQVFGKERPIYDSDKITFSYEELNFSVEYTEEYYSFDVVDESYSI